MKYILTYKGFVLCTDNKWRKLGFAENEIFIDNPLDAQTLAKEKRNITGKNIKISRGTI
jgi:hypothetical protein